MSYVASKVDDDKDNSGNDVIDDEDDRDAEIFVVGCKDLSFATDTARAARRCARIRHFPSFDNCLLYSKDLHLY